MAAEESIAANDKNNLILKEFYSSNKFLYFLILASIVLSYYGPYLAYPALKEASFYRIAQIVIAPFLIFIPIKLSEKYFSSNKPLVFLMLFILYANISVFWSDDLSRSIYYVYFLLSGFLTILLILFYADSKMIKILIFGLFAFIFSNILLAPVEILFDYHLPYSAVILYPKLANIPTGFFHDPNDLGTALQLVIPFFLFLIFWRKNLWWLASTGTVFSLLILFVSGSRGGWLGLILSIIGGIILFYHRYKKMFLELLARFSILFVFLLLLLVAIPVSDSTKLMPSKVLSKIETLNAESIREGTTPEISSLYFRIRIIYLSYQSLKNNLFGLGPGMSDIYIGKAFFFPLIYYNPHNMWGEVAIDYGLPGLLFFVLFYFSLLIKLYQTFHSASDGFVKYLTAASFISLTGFIISSISPSTVWRPFPVMWTIFGLALYAIKKDQDYKITA